MINKRLKRLAQRPVYFAFILASFIFFSGCSKFQSESWAQAPLNRLAKPAPPICRGETAPYQMKFEIRDESSPANLKQFLLQQSNFRDSLTAMSLRQNSYLTPTKRVPLEQWPELLDDLNFAEMPLAIDRQIAHYQQINLSGYIRLGNDVYPLAQAEKSLEVFKYLIEKDLACTVGHTYQYCLQRFNSEVRAQFNLYEPSLDPGDPRYGEPDDALFTGYYTPDISVSRIKTAIYNHAIYAMPATDSLRQSSRDLIDFHNRLAGQHLSLFYASDLFSVYLAQIQGNAHVFIQGAEHPASFYLNYSGTNGLRWRFISEYMYRMHYINNTSIHAQHQFLREHPNKQEQIYSTCPSYVYFEKTTSPPIGSGDVPVTANRTIATDENYYPFKGLLAFVQAQRPTAKQNLNTPCPAIQFQNFSRFFIDQDSGGAIRGKARADIYFGEGSYARLAAYNEDTRGNIYFLMLKK